MNNKYKTDSYTLKWVSFSPTFNAGLYIDEAGYFDERPVLVASLTQLLVVVLIPVLLMWSSLAGLLIPFVFTGWGAMHVCLPIRSGIYDCESGTYGVGFHDNKIWLYIGAKKGFNDVRQRKYITITMPWDLILVEHLYYCNNGKWRSVFSDSYEERETNKATQAYPFTDRYDNSQTIATLDLYEKEFRYKGLKWTSLFSLKKRGINVSFHDEIGQGKDTHKGGVLATSYTWRDDETVLGCLRRMEREYKF